MTGIEKRWRLDKKDESEFLGRGHNGIRKGLGPREEERRKGMYTEEGKRMTGCKTRKNGRGIATVRWEMVVNIFFYYNPEWMRERLSGMT